MVRQIQLTERNGDKAEALSRQTGMTPDQLVNDAFDQFSVAPPDDEQKRFQEWREAAKRVAGIWKDRDDLPDFDELRKSWDRGYINRD